MSALISADDLRTILGNSDTRVLDATFPVASAEPVRIPGARAFDIDDIADPHAPLAHTAPDAAYFQQKVRELGINVNDHIVVYDQHGGYMAAARVWWLFRLLGHTHVQVLDGGLNAWISKGYQTDHSATSPAPMGDFTAVLNPDLIKTYKDMKNNVENPTFTVLDARDPMRFENEGHIPNSQSLFFGQFINPDTGTIKQDVQIDIPENEKLTASCNSGVTACYTALALFEAGHRNVAVYDGSWQDWLMNEQK